jgi:FkbM family methyltransferase
VADRSQALVKLFVNPNQTLISSSDSEFTQRKVKNVSTSDVRTITLDDLLVEFGVTQVDFLNMDIELSEPKALDGFRFRSPAGHPSVRILLHKARWDVPHPKLYLLWTMTVACAVCSQN